MTLKDDSRLKTEFEKVREEYVMTLPSALKLKGIPISERLEGIPTSERLKGVPTSERLKGINKAELLDAFGSPELPPEFWQQLADALARRRAQKSI